LHLKELKSSKIPNGDDIEVIAVPCVGDDEFLADSMRKQVASFTTTKTFQPDEETMIPKVLSSKNSPRRVFAKPYLEHMNLWQSLQEQSAIDSFDLVYAPRAFEILLSKSYANKVDLTAEYKTLLADDQCHLLYYHCGGAEGNESMLNMYKYKKIIS
jgi:1-aminocyclopropane-1-carboxylate deaminase/D-cysteine desulfhydrase-like pyridoxal-dependent ACC family enzyme